MGVEVKGGLGRRRKPNKRMVGGGDEEVDLGDKMGVGLKMLLIKVEIPKPLLLPLRSGNFSLYREARALAGLAAHMESKARLSSEREPQAWPKQNLSQYKSLSAALQF